MPCTKKFEKGTCINEDGDDDCDCDDEEDRDCDHCYGECGCGSWQYIGEWVTRPIPYTRNLKRFSKVIMDNYPNSDFALDAEYKLELIQEILASKEMYLAKYYIEREKWIPAINRYKNILDKYETTIFVEEALHRLVEIHYKIGLVEESKKYAALLGYNYQSSDWYRESYKVFNKDYERISKRKKVKNKKSTLDKIKSLLKNEK